MKLPRALRFLLLAALLLPAAAPAQSSSASLAKLADRQLEVRRKINELFALRDEPPKPFGAELNLFVLDRHPEEDLPATIVSDEEALEDPNLSPDERILASLLKAIRVAGVVTVSDRQFIVINQVPIPEGGVAIIEVNGVARALRVENIGLGEVTVSHGTARMIFVY